jgi:hypothetical protein
MPRVVTSLLSLAFVLAGFIAQAAGDSRAGELLAQARQALGGEKQLAKVQGLSVTGTAQRVIGDRTLDGELTIDLQLPDKFWRTDSIAPMGDGAAIIVNGQGINGDKLLRTSKVLNAPPGAVIRTPPPPAPGSDAEAQAMRNSRAELARLTLALLVAAPPSMPLEFTAAGQAESPDGKADVIDVKGPNSFAAKLFLDTTTHRPLMLMYRGIAPRVVITTQRSDAPPPADRQGAGRGETIAPPSGDLVDINMFFDDYKNVDGVLLPHHVTRSVDGKPSEEWTLKSITVNPVFKTDTFSGK